MCGIAGIVRFDDKPFENERFGKILGYLAHRGPDDHGVSQTGRCVLLHTRLAIIDPAGGKQPMRLSKPKALGELLVTFNGEIYNHRALKQELTALGHRFVTDHADTEVLLHGYRQWGRELPAHLEGMFAFAIWEEKKKELFLCRDRFGKKPLFWRWSRRGEDWEFLFGSLPGVLWEGALEGDHTPGLPGAEALLEYLTFGYHHNGSLSGTVEEVPAGHSMLVNGEGGTALERYWEIPKSAGMTGTNKTRTPEQLVMELEGCVRQAVVERLEADVPLGCFLSGGIDSSIVAAMAQEEIKKKNGESLQTFTMAMNDVAYDESGKAELVAKHLGTRHTTFRTQPFTNVVEDLQHLMKITGEPLADSSILPTYWLSRATREHVKVALSGDGGDELFGGYERYRALAMLGKYRRWILKMPLQTLIPVPMHRPRSMRYQLLRLRNAAEQETPVLQYRQIVGLFSAEQMVKICPPVREAMGINAISLLGNWDEEEADVIWAGQTWDMKHYLPMDLMRKVDRASMAVALEVRCPLLARGVSEFAFGLTTDQRMPGGRIKGLLRQLASKYVSKSIAEQEKRGFALPIGGWFRSNLKSSLQEYVLEGPLMELGFSKPALEEMITEHNEAKKDHSQRLFALLSLAIWLKMLKQPKRRSATRNVPLE